MTPCLPLVIEFSQVLKTQVFDAQLDSDQACYSYYLVSKYCPYHWSKKIIYLFYLSQGAGKTWTVRAAVDRLHKKFGSFDYEICEITLASYSGPELFGWEDEKGKYNFG